MNIFESLKEIPIVGYNCKNYEYLTYNGCDYIILVPEKKIALQFNIDFDKCKIFKTCRVYNCICYDQTEQCYWATCKQNPNSIFKLDLCMHEIDCIVINAQKPNIFIGISYDCCKDCFLLATQRCIIKSDKCGSSPKKILSYDDCIITGILSLSPGLMVTVRKGKQQCILLYTGVLSVSLSITVPTCYCIKNIVINPCADKKMQNTIAFLALTIKHMYYPFVLDLNVPIDCISFTINECIFDVCRENCDDPCSKADCDIVESIALVEAALSHILNAEGEKLQKVIATTDDIDKILCVNREVNKTIINATHLEHALYAKLEAVEAACPSSICGTLKEQNSQLVIGNTVEYSEKELQADSSSVANFVASKANESQAAEEAFNIENFSTNENLIDKDPDEYNLAEDGKEESVSKNSVSKFLKRFYLQSDDHKHLDE